MAVDEEQPGENPSTKKDDLSQYNLDEYDNDEPEAGRYTVFHYWSWLSITQGSGHSAT